MGSSARSALCEIMRCRYWPCFSVLFAGRSTCVFGAATVNCAFPCERLQRWILAGLHDPWNGWRQPGTPQLWKSGVSSLENYLKFLGSSRTPNPSKVEILWNFVSLGPKFRKIQKFRENSDKFSSKPVEKVTNLIILKSHNLQDLQRKIDAWYLILANILTKNYEISEFGAGSTRRFFHAFFLRDSKGKK